MKQLKTTLYYLSFTFLLVGSLKANVSVPSLWSNHMVLQQNDTVKLHGWGHPSEKVTITTTWSNDTLKAQVDNQANWSAMLKTPQAGGPYSIKIQGYNTLQIKDVLIGEVWLLGGQSNMEWTTSSGVIGGEEAIKKANNKNIRFFTVTKRTSNHASFDINGHWEVCTPETMPYFSAIGYFFGEKLQKNLKFPIGLISSNWGGTPIETWLPKDTIDNNPKLLQASQIQTPVPWGPVEPGRCYNAMISPLTPMPLAGVLWYQGEANTINADSYQLMLSTLISSWRTAFHCNFPFYFAQIAPYNDYGKNTGVKVRDQQRRTLSVSQTGMIVLSDIGDTTKIHPRKKIEAGQRFANLALNQTYGMKNFHASGPLYSNFEINGSRITVSFDYNKGLYSTEKTISLFEISGEDHIWHSARAIIKNDKVIVSCQQVKKPQDIRYAWSNAAIPTLFNENNIPASCFTTKK